MRKCLILYAVLLLCALVFLSAAMAAVDSGKTAITVTETTLTGDAAAAAGLIVEQFQNADHRLFWHTTYEAAAEPEPETEFEFGQSRYEEELTVPTPFVDVQLASLNFGMSGAIDLEKYTTDPGYDPNIRAMEPVRDVANRTPVGESRTEVVSLGNYYDVYPLQVHGDVWFFTLIEDSIYNQQQQFLEDYFSIPVPEEELLEITVTRDHKGNVMDVNCHQYIPEGEDPDLTEFYCTSVVREDCVYLLPCGNAEMGQIRGGYGIYRIPITYVKQMGGITYSEPQPHLEVERIENIYPLPETCADSIRLLESPNQEELLLFLMEDERAVLQILDRKDLSVKQVLDLDRDEVPSLWPCGDLLVCVYDLYTEEATIQVWQPGAEGYSLWLDTDLYPMYEMGRYNEPVLAFDGNRLAVAALWEYYRLASCRISVYDESGVVYAGDYAINTDTLPQENSLNNYNWVEPLQLRWE